MIDSYLWCKVAHLVSLISWMAGLFYLPRLFIYHVDAVPGSSLDETLQVMERRLLRIIMNPAMISTYVFGITLMIQGNWWRPGPGNGWMHAKLLFVLLLSGGHGFFAKCRKNFVHQQNIYSARFFRIANEVPPLLMIVILILVVIKPF